MRAWLLLSCICLLLATSAAGFGSIKESESELIATKQHNLMREVSQADLFPPFPIEPAGNQLYVIAYMGGAYSWVLAIGPKGDDSRRIAGVLDTFQAAHGLGRDVEWSDEDDGVAARLTFQKNSHFGLAHGQTSVIFGEVLDDFRKAGFEPLAVVRTPKYGKLVGLGGPLPVGTSHLYDARSLHGSSSVAFSADLPAFWGPLFLVWLFFVPVIGGLGFATAVLMGRQESIPIVKRRQLYPKIVFGSTFGAIALHAPAFFVLIFSGALSSVCDLWFGEMNASAIVPFIAAGPLLMLPWLVLTKGVEKKLFGPDPDKPQPEVVVSPEEKAYRMKRMKISLVAIAIILAADMAVIAFAPKKHAGPVMVLLPVLAMAMVFIPNLVAKKLVPGGEKYDIGEFDPTLQAKVDGIASSMNAASREVRVLMSAENQIVVSGKVGIKRIVFSQAALNQLSSAELDFLIAHELAHVKFNHTSRRLLILGAAALAFVGFQTYIMTTVGPNRSGLILGFFAVLMAVFVLMLFLGPRLRRKAEIQADQLALETTRNLEAAVSCLEKSVATARMPHINDIDGLSHPSIFRRIQALRTFATAAGI